MKTQRSPKTVSGSVFQEAKSDKAEGKKPERRPSETPDEIKVFAKAKPK